MSRSLDKIYTKMQKIAGPNKGGKKKNKEAFIIKSLEKIGKELKKTKKEAGNTDSRIKNILEVVEAYAKLDFNKKSRIGATGNNFDALASGINMLGEELQSSTVSLNEKEVLLKEIHHRVKNNLQIISSLLNLQAEQLSDKNLLHFFTDNMRRVKSMALVHETLYQSENLSQVDFRKYLQALIDSIKDAYRDSKNINFILNAESHNLNIDIAIPCGLIINELITNSLKYAFEGRKQGKIELRFTREKKRGKTAHYKLNIRDNGIGLPKKFDIYKSESLGLQLVTMLSKQLDGSLLFEINNGVSFTIIFPD
jgi:two-component sensor histidine kinase